MAKICHARKKSRAAFGLFWKLLSLRKKRFSESVIIKRKCYNLTVFRLGSKNVQLEFLQVLCVAVITLQTSVHFSVIDLFYKRQFHMRVRLVVSPLSIDLRVRLFVSAKSLLSKYYGL